MFKVILFTRHDYGTVIKIKCLAMNTPVDNYFAKNYQIENST